MEPSDAQVSTPHLRSGGIEDRLASTSPTESSIVFTEAYNTGFEGTPLRDLSTPPPTHFWRPQFSEEDYDRMCEIKEEEYEPDISDAMDVDETFLTETTIIEDPEGYLASHLPTLNLTNQGVRRNPRHRWAVAGGGFADVWKGTLKRTEVAIKVARVYGSRPLVSAQKRAVAEMIIWSRLRHKHVMRLLGYITEEDGRISIVTPWQHNGTAREFVLGKSNWLKMNVMIGACLGLRYLHSKDIVHGDFRGDNILINHDGSAILSDFGLSRRISSALFSSTSQDMGNTAWLAPELLIGNQIAKHTKMSDVWACGMTLMELFWNVLPYQPLSPPQILNAVVRDHKLPECPRPHFAALWNVCRKCWHSIPNFRAPISAVVLSLRGLRPPNIHPSSGNFNEECASLPPMKKTINERTPLRQYTVHPLGLTCINAMPPSPRKRGRIEGASDAGSPTTTPKKTKKSSAARPIRGTPRIASSPSPLSSLIITSPVLSPSLISGNLRDIGNYLDQDGNYMVPRAPQYWNVEKGGERQRRAMQRARRFQENNPPLSASSNKTPASGLEERGTEEEKGKGDMKRRKLASQRVVHAHRPSDSLSRVPHRHGLQK